MSYSSGSISTPSATNDPNYWGLFEYAITSGGLDIDMSEVDQVGFPFTITTTPAAPIPANDGVGITQHRGDLFNLYSQYIAEPGTRPPSLFEESISAGSPVSHPGAATFDRGDAICRHYQAAVELYRMPAVKAGSKGAIVMDDTSMFLPPGLAFGPYRWVGAHYFRHSKAVLLNSPFLYTGTMPLKVAPSSLTPMNPLGTEISPPTMERLLLPMVQPRQWILWSSLAIQIVCPPIVRWAGYARATDS